MDFYYTPVSAPCRGAMLTANALGIKLNMKTLALFEGEHLKPEFLAINPQHTIPTLVDGDLKLWESGAICTYLVNQYAKEDSLYPKCPKKRAQVDKMLFFGIGTLYDRFIKYVFPVVFGGASPSADNLKKVHEGLDFLDGFLSAQDYVCGSAITIADHSLVASVSTFQATGIDMVPHPNVSAWLARCSKNMPGYSVNQNGADMFGANAKSKFEAASNKPTMDFYYLPLSAPCRGAMLTAEALGIKLNMKPLALFEGEHLKPEFIAINPQHCIPTLVDDDVKLWESRAICAYLVNQYAKEDSLYPKCPKKRAQVDKMLYFDIGTLYYRFGKYAFPVMFGGASPNADNLKKVHEGLDFLDGFLSGQNYVCGNAITIADHSLVASVSSFKAAGIEMAPHPNVIAWLARCSKNMPGYSVNQDGADKFGAMAKSKFEAAAKN